MSGHANYDFDVNDYVCHEVKIIVADEDNFREYGNFVYDYDEEKVEIVPWPTLGKRPLCVGTGVEGGIAEGEFKYWLKDDIFYADNMAVANGKYIIGKKVGNMICTREANYHPDGGQVFYPKQCVPFIMLLALPTDDIKPQDFVGFYFNGEYGIQIKPNIWHQPVYTIQDTIFKGKQGKVHACVCFDSIEEFNTILCINVNNLF